MALTERSYSYEMQLIVSNFIRIHFETKDNKNIDVPLDLKDLIKQFSTKIILSRLTTDNEDLEFIELLST